MPPLVTFRDALRAALQHEFNQTWGALPETLYRYVAQERAQSIREGKLWASGLRTHKRAENGDLHEFTLGWGIVTSTARALGEESDDELTKDICKMIANDRDPFTGSYDAYMVCLTTQPNAPHMWDKFADGGGVRFGLRTAELRQGIRYGGSTPRLLPVRYDPDDLIDAVETMIRSVAVPNAQSRLATYPHLQRTAAAGQPYWELRSIFVPMALSFKRGLYRREREWRFIATPVTEEPIPNERKGVFFEYEGPAGSHLPVTDELTRPAT